MSSNWGIKTDDGYVNFIHGTIDKIWDFETSSSIDDIVIFSERAAKGYAKAIKANAIQISISEQPQLTIPKSIADELNKPDALWNGMGTPFSDHPEAYRAVTIQSLNYALSYNAGYKWNTEVKNVEYVKENYALVSAYLAGKALGVDLVKVVADD